MKNLASLALLLATLLFSISAISADECADAARTASGLAQDYRNAVGKVRLACDRSSEECEQARAHSAAVLALLNEAYGGVLSACFFVADSSHGNDSIKVSAATVAAAIDTFPESFLVPCITRSFLGLEFDIGCPGGSFVSIPKSNLIIQSTATPTVFNYSLNVGLSGSTSIRNSLFGTCTLTAGTSAPGELVMGSATFSSSTQGGAINRLTLALTSASTQSVNFSGCGIVGDVLDLLVDIVRSLFYAQVIAALSGQFCGAVGPELFGPCP